MQIGIVGKPNVGKSTFFNAITRASAEVANYPFTTIESNKDLAAVRVPEPAEEFGLEPHPRNSWSRGGYRFVPVEAIDVAGLVPGAHQGKGLGNKFLDELRQASVLIHVVDASGSTGEEGQPVSPGEHDPCREVRFLNEEIELWFLGIFKKHWDRIAKRVQIQGNDFYRQFAQTFSSLGIKEAYLRRAVNENGLDPEKPDNWSGEQLFSFTRSLRKRAMPTVIAANKVDVGPAEENLREMREEFPEMEIVPTSSMAELVLSQMDREGALSYTPGNSGFEILEEGRVDKKQEKALGIIQKVLEKYSGTGVQTAVNTSVLEELEKIVVFPVEDEKKLSDKKGRVLPDAFLLDAKSTPRDLAYKIHTQIGENFVAALDARSGRRVASDRELKHLDIVKIQSRA